MIYIYSLTDPITQEIRYVGKTTAPERRYIAHRNATDGRHDKRAWVKSLKAAGRVPLLDVLEEVDCDEKSQMWADAERYWIAYLRFIGCPLLNFSAGGYGGYKHKPETIEVIRQMKRAENLRPETRAKMSASQKGRKLSPEIREKMRRSHLGRKHSEFHCKRISEGNTGKKMSEEARRNIGAASLGRRHTDETKRRIGAAFAGKSKSEATKERMRVAWVKRRQAMAPTA